MFIVFIESSLVCRKAMFYNENSSEKRHFAAIILYSGGKEWK